MAVAVGVRHLVNELKMLLFLRINGVIPVLFFSFFFCRVDLRPKTELSLGICLGSWTLLLDLMSALDFGVLTKLALFDYL